MGSESSKLHKDHMAMFPDHIEPIPLDEDPLFKQDSSPSYKELKEAIHQR